MRATNWEFQNRALIFGLIFGVAFPLYLIDHANSAASLADWLARKLGWNADLLARALFAAAAMLLVLAAALRTWASAYLNAGVVYGAKLKTESVVADGPYRRVRNPLYLANVMMVIALGAIMSRVGLVFAVAAVVIFCYRLILREESELCASQGAQYQAYTKTVPRLWPSLGPEIPSSGRKPQWGDGLRAELWYWGFAAGLIAFAVTLNLPVFFVILAASIAVLWFASRRRA
jgi:protein-S-isoprenylcysteine O-methyltransferase Ste14